MFLSVFIVLALFISSMLSDKRRDEKEKIAAPYHESGHVILAMVTGMGFEKVSIEENAHHLGFMSHRTEQYEVGRMAYTQEFFTLSERERLENALMTSLAGYVSEVLLCGKPGLPSHNLPYGDMEVVNGILSQNAFLYQEKNQTIDEYLSALTQKTQNILQQESQAHQMISEALTIKKTLTEEEVWDLMDDSFLGSHLHNPYSSLADASLALDSSGA